MGSFFDSLHSTEVDLLGPDYPYYEKIKTPKELGVTSGNTFDDLAADIGGLIDYVELLVSGQSVASKTGQPLGDKFFLKTAAMCNGNSSDSSSNSVNRYIYINNVPEGNIPFVSAGINADFSDFRGLIPGIMSNLNVLNPTDIFKSFTLGSNPPCRELKMQVIDASDNISYESQYVLDSDIKSMDPCLFISESDPNGARVNPITNSACREAFQNINSNVENMVYNAHLMPKDIIVQIYYISLSLLALYLLLKMCQKTKLKN